jgi:ATP-dependent DNA helicase DinG
MTETALALPDTPNVIGLPDKFPGWRPIQLRAIADGCASKRRWVAQALATGTGKSLSNVAQAALHGRGVYLTHTRALQNQLHGDFECAGMVDLRGRANYACVAGRTCEDGYYAKCARHTEDLCPYINQLEHAKRSLLVDENYAHWMALNKYSGGLGCADLLICDEADSVIDALCDMLTIEISNGDLHWLQVHAPEQAGTIEGWQKWCKSTGVPAAKRVLAEADKVKDVGAMREISRITAAMGELLNVKGKWVADETYVYSSGAAVQTGYRFDPIWPAEYTEKLLWCGVPKILLTAATLNRKTCSVLGIPSDELDFFDYPPVFDPHRAPITWIRGSGRVDHRMDEAAVRAWISRIDQVLRRWPNSKGIIHCTSYLRQKDIQRLSRERDRLLWHHSGNTQARIEQFKMLPADSGAVFLSPAVTTGYSFPDDECRFQIVAKIPMIDTRSKIMKARISADPEYGDNLTVQALEQSCGRPVRSMDDWCMTYVLDDHWAWWWPKMLKKGLASRGFTARVTSPSDGIPVLEFA